MKLVMIVIKLCDALNILLHMVYAMSLEIIIGSSLASSLCRSKVGIRNKPIANRW